MTYGSSDVEGGSAGPLLDREMEIPSKPTYRRATGVVVALALMAGAAVVTTRRTANTAATAQLMSGPTSPGDCPDGCVSGFVANGGCALIMTGDMTTIESAIPAGLGCEENDACGSDAMDSCMPGGAAPTGMTDDMMGTMPPMDGTYGGGMDGTYGYGYASGGGTCAGACGGNGGGCWCDSLCTGYGDCCADFTADCPNVAGMSKKSTGKKTVRKSKVLSKAPIDVRSRANAKKNIAAKKAVVAKKDGGCPAGCISGFMANGGCSLMMTGDKTKIESAIPLYLGCEGVEGVCASDATDACMPKGGVMPGGAAPTGMTPPMDMYYYGSGAGMGSGSGDDMPPPPMDMYYYGSGAGMGSGSGPPPAPDCPVCIASFTAANGCDLLQTIAAGGTPDDATLAGIDAAIPAGCDEAGDDCGADALAECGFDPSMFDDADAEDDWGNTEPATADGGDSCVDHCGGSGGSCWCDSYCSSYGDCCSDFVDDCPDIAADPTGSDDGGMNGMYGYAPPADGTCDGNCGGYGGSCWCDSACSMYGDCCADFDSVCPECSGGTGGTYGSYGGGSYGYGAYGGGSYGFDAEKKITKNVKTAVRPTKALSKRPKDVKARKSAKKIAAVKAAKRSTRQTKALSKRPIDVDARKATKAKRGIKKFASGVKHFAKRAIAKKWGMPKMPSSMTSFKGMFDKKQAAVKKSFGMPKKAALTKPQQKAALGKAFGMPKKAALTKPQQKAALEKVFGKRN